MKNHSLQTESTDWLGEAAECLVRYVIAEALRRTKKEKSGKNHIPYWVFGASKWGSDIAVIESAGRVQKLVCLIEVKSGGIGSWKKLSSKFYQYNFLVRVELQVDGGFRIKFYKTKGLEKKVSKKLKHQDISPDLIIVLGSDVGGKKDAPAGKRVSNWGGVLVKFLESGITPKAGPIIYFNSN